MAVNAKALAKAAALLAWADDKLEVDELKTIQEIFKKHGIDWKEAKPLVEAEMEVFIAGDESEEEKDEEIVLGALDFGEVDSKDILDDLAALAVADKVVDFSEVEMLHKIGSAANVNPEFVTAALLEAVKKTNASLNFS